MEINGLRLVERKVWTGKKFEIEYAGMDEWGQHCVFGRTKRECLEEMRRWKQGK